ncbi:MAG TPA: chain length determinant protein tyrosine kinase EpsG [Burkholderiaceae bacterium]|nr:chain length determinant protein tyrosine kinase EpsG [Burkholderiaceae bacterium]
MNDALKIGVFPQKSDDRMIGGILVDSGKLTIDDADRILRLQKGENMRFGEAGIKLGLLNSCDLQFALSRQFDYPYLRKGESSIGDELIAAYQPFSPRVEPLRALRSQLMLRCFTGSDNRRSLAIVSPERGEGRSYIAANLAVVFSQLGERTLLIDADMRNPRQCKLFNLGNNMGLSSILSERIRGDAVQRVPDLLDLSVLVAGASPPNPQELIGRPAFTKMLEEFEADYDVVLIDTPPCSEYADAQNIAARTGATVMVARKHKTRVELVREHTMLMMQSGAQVVGTLLNEF